MLVNTISFFPWCVIKAFLLSESWEVLLQQEPKDLSPLLTRCIRPSLASKPKSSPAWRLQSVSRCSCWTFRSPVFCFHYSFVVLFSKAFPLFPCLLFTWAISVCFFCFMLFSLALRLSRVLFHEANLLNLTLFPKNNLVWYTAQTLSIYAKFYKWTKLNKTNGSKYGNIACIPNG